MVPEAVLIIYLFTASSTSRADSRTDSAKEQSLHARCRRRPRPKPALQLAIGEGFEDERQGGDGSMRRRGAVHEKLSKSAAWKEKDIFNLPLYLGDAVLDTIEEMFHFLRFTRILWREMEYSGKAMLFVFPGLSHSFLIKRVVIYARTTSTSVHPFCCTITICSREASSPLVQHLAYAQRCRQLIRTSCRDG